MWTRTEAPDLYLQDFLLCNAAARLADSEMSIGKDKEGFCDFSALSHDWSHNLFLYKRYWLDIEFSVRPTEHQHIRQVSPGVKVFMPSFCAPQTDSESECSLAEGESSKCLFALRGKSLRWMSCLHTEKWCRRAVRCDIWTAAALIKLPLCTI